MSFTHRFCRPFATPTATARPTRASISSPDWAPELPDSTESTITSPRGIRHGMDGFLYIAVGDKGIPHAVGRDGKTIQLQGGGVIRVRPDGTGLEVVSTGECNPLSVALSATDEVFTYGNDDDSKKWPNSLTHHIVGGHYGYPYQFLTAHHRALPIMWRPDRRSRCSGHLLQRRRAARRSIKATSSSASGDFRRSFGSRSRSRAAPSHCKRRTVLVSKGDVPDFRPFSLAVAADGQSLWLVDWAYNGWLASGPRTGRLYRLRYTGANPVVPAARPTGDDSHVRIKALDHPALAVRLESQRILVRKGPAVVPALDRPAQGRPTRSGAAARALGS